MNQKVLLGILMLVITAVQFILYFTGYRDNAFTPPLIGCGITLLAGIYLLVLGRKEKNR